MKVLTKGTLVGLFGVVVGLAGTALADPQFETPILLSGEFRFDTDVYTWQLPGGTTWGELQGSGVPVTMYSGGMPAGTLRVYGESLPPPQGKKFKGRVGLEPTEVTQPPRGGFARADVRFEEIKRDDEPNYVNEASATGPLGPVVPPNGTVIITQPDGKSIIVKDVPGAELLVFPFVTLEWTQREGKKPGPALTEAGLIGLPVLFVTAMAIRLGRRRVERSPGRA